MKIAIEGCMHGELDKVYATLKRLEEEEKTKIDLLLCCGDFQAVRNLNDLESLNVKPKYRSMNSFWKYYSGQAVAPYPTIFIGGNHEASNYLWELYYGGWAAPNIYFLGFAGVVKFGDIRIGGLSGIFKQNHYSLGHFERPPYNESDIRSIYHVREYDVLKLMQIEEPIDIFISHDWPLGITEYGNWKKLLREKPFFKEEVEKRSLGSRPAAELLGKLKPPYWFSAHLHCKFPAIIQHGEDGPVTKFLALDKCLPRRKFLQILEIESEPGPFEIHFDEEWLTITRMFNSSFPFTRRSARFVAEQLGKQAHQQWVRNKLSARGPKPFDFVRTVPSYDPDQPHPSTTLDGHCRNPQTEAFLQLLELPYLLDAAAQSNTPVESSLHSADAHLHSSYINDESIDLDDMDDMDDMEELTTNEDA
ncbi:lariat debranching enzyme protein [Dioscorea alata]|uniref:Lariat debranching enzyme protein n=3 Tax=Dioscorea alata TaxID=55571 RepID=A0ACB7WNQ0_DIOAL|nr:lariat debranching enzyme protein [Dioscorea alata]KAH7689831.1 lariat debranching enzyme protein [Dioscorea alata]KAH7689832.1 lariat debranching enzyme protein [Dioscorea alata]